MARRRALPHAVNAQYPSIESFQTDKKHTYLKPDLVHYRALRQGDIKIFHGSSLQDYQHKLSAVLKIEGGTPKFSGSVEVEFDQTSRSTTTMEFTTAMELYSRAFDPARRARADADPEALGAG